MWNAFNIIYEFDVGTPQNLKRAANYTHGTGKAIEGRNPKDKFFGTPCSSMPISLMDW